MTPFEYALAFGMLITGSLNTISKLLTSKVPLGLAPFVWIVSLTNWSHNPIRCHAATKIADTTKAPSIDGHMGSGSGYPVFNHPFFRECLVVSWPLH